MKKFLSLLTVFGLVAVFAATSLGVAAAGADQGVAQRNQANVNQSVNNDDYRPYHRAHQLLDQNLTREEYLKEVEKYREECKEQLEKDLKADVDAGRRTQAEADQILENFELRGGFCGRMLDDPNNTDARPRARYYSDDSLGYNRGGGLGCGYNCRW